MTILAPGMRQIADWITQVLAHLGEEAVARQVREEVTDLCLRFPVPTCICNLKSVGGIISYAD